MQPVCAGITSKCNMVSYGSLFLTILKKNVLFREYGIVCSLLTYTKIVISSNFILIVISHSCDLFMVHSDLVLQTMR